MIQSTNDGHARRYRGGTRTRLVAEQRQVFHARAHEPEPGLGTAAREVGTLRQEAVAGMNGIATGRFRGRDERLRVQVGGGPGAREGMRLVGRPEMRALGVVRGVHRHGAQAQVGGRAGDADGDLAPVGDQQFRQAHDASFSGMIAASVQTGWVPIIPSHGAPISHVRDLAA